MEWLKLIWEDYRKYCLIAICGLVCIIGFAVKNGGASAPGRTQMQDNNFGTRQSPKNKMTAASTSKMIYVDVKGAVNRPGVYALKSGLRIQDALTKAGGTTSEADINHVNMAQQVNDQQVVYVPVKGEVTTPIGSDTAESGDSDNATGPIVNLNTATKEQLLQITGVGDKKADLILQYRQEHGQFKSVEDLKEVNGFGDRSVANIKDQLSV
ncbi:helix-hairpin-helix domain-containing protein [Paucilactobacillus kaifaensis]|uniref:helix-hairpin-helix domain-containing protein n=1 Tax=Paucilactobacillus kaifaensis TaxID=2559921 RepID=UPI0010F77B51|nr:helix-hairpin-helix domain-containing protein [Paucilactobacillus kaifaensis]